MHTAAALAGVTHVDLINCNRLTEEDVSALVGAVRVSLSDCPNLTDVSALGGVRVLRLAICDTLTDVSALGHVLTLTYQNARRRYRCFNASHCATPASV